MNGYRSLDVWQRSMKVSSAILTLVATFPKAYQFGLCLQMQKAAVSIPSNIAEGANRTSRKEFAHFLSIALGSTGELETQCNLAVMARIVDKQKIVSMMSELDEIGKMLRAMIRTLSKPTSN